MNNDINSVEIKIETKSDTDYDTDTDSNCSDKKVDLNFNSENLILLERRYFDLYGKKLTKNCIKKIGNEIHYRYNNHSKFSIFNNNLLLEPNIISSSFYQRKIKAGKLKFYSGIVNDYNVISKVKNPWIHNNKFNKDGFIAFINWFKADIDNKIIYDSLNILIKKIDTRLKRFEIKYLRDEINENFHLYKIENMDDMYSLQNFTYEQKNLAFRLKDFNLTERQKLSLLLENDKNFKQKEILCDKIVNQEWWEKIVEDEKIYCIKCCKNRNYCCSLHIPYYSFFIISVLFSMCVQLFDFGSDIYVLIDLHDKEKYYFYCCLFIIIISAFVNSMLSGILGSNKKIKPAQPIDQIRFPELKCDKNTIYFIFNFVLGLLQINIFKEAFWSIWIKEKTHAFIWGRCMEGLIESAPQSLFQLFIVLKNSENRSYYDLARYYFSIILSITSLALGLVSFEMYRYRYENIVKKGFITNCYIPTIKELSFFSPFMIILGLFRIFELSSRIIFIGLLSYITKSGFSIIIFLLVDIILSTYLPLLIDISNLEHKYLLKNDLGREIKENFYKSKTWKKKCLMIFSFFVILPLRNLPNLPSLWKPFTTRLSTEKLDTLDYYHYPIKAFTDFIVLLFIVFKFKEGDYNLSFIVLSTISIFGCISKYILLYFLKKWNTCNNFKNENNFNEKAKYIDKFKPFDFSFLNNCCKTKFN